MRNCFSDQFTYATQQESAAQSASPSILPSSTVNKYIVCGSEPRAVYISLREPKAYLSSVYEVSYDSSVDIPFKKVRYYVLGCI